MRYPSRPRCIGLTILVTLCLGLSLNAQTSFPLQKVGVWETERDLVFFYTFYASPLIIVNKTVYIPHHKCVELRGYGGTYMLRDLAGNVVLKSEGGDIVEKASDGEHAERTQGVDSDSKMTDGEQNSRSQDAEIDAKNQAGVIDLKQKEEALDLRQEDGSDIQKNNDGAEDQREMEGEHEQRDGSEAAEQKSFGGVTLYIKCMPDNGRMDLINFLSSAPLYLYDIHGLQEVKSFDIMYEQ